MKYKSKLFFVDAIQLTESNFEEVKSFLGAAPYEVFYANESDHLKKQNPKYIFIKQRGANLALIGDYILKCEGGLFDICVEERFLNSFEAIAEPVKAVGD